MVMTYAEIEVALAGYDPALLADWCVDLNCFRWPKDCPVPMPQGYGVAPRRCRDGSVVDRFTLHQALWHVLMHLTTGEDRSRSWWRLALGRTDEAWQDWWDANPAAEEAYIGLERRQSAGVCARRDTSSREEAHVDPGAPEAS